MQDSVYEPFVSDATERVKAIVQGSPLDTGTMVGAQASTDQLEKILSYIDIGTKEGARIITGGERVDLGGDLSGGYYVAPTIFEGPTRCGSEPCPIFRPAWTSPRRRRSCCAASGPSTAR